MENKDKLSLMQFAIGRFDHYYDSVNNKGNVYLTLNAALLAGVVTGYYALSRAEVSWVTHVMVVAILVCNLLSTGFTLCALYPYLKKKPTSLIGSLLWFGDISCETQLYYSQRWAQVTESELLNDALAQTHILACGLNKKFRKLQKATWFLIIELFLIAAGGLFNLK